MFTEYYFVYVIEYIERSFPNANRKYRLLWIRFPKSWKKLCFDIPNDIAMPFDLKKGEKVRLKIHVFTRGKSFKPQFTVAAIERIEEKKDV